MTTTTGQHSLEILPGDGSTVSHTSKSTKIMAGIMEMSIMDLAVSGKLENSAFATKCWIRLRRR